MVFLSIEVPFANGEFSTRNKTLSKIEAEAITCDKGMLIVVENDGNIVESESLKEAILQWAYDGNSLE